MRSIASPMLEVHETASATRYSLAQNLLRSRVRPTGDPSVDVLTWLFALYARYFVAVFAVGTVVLCILWLVTFRSHPRTSPEPSTAQTSAPDGRTAA